MTAILKPGVTFQIIPAAQLAGVQDQKCLIVGQMLSGSATAGNLVTDIGDAGEENALFGRTSHVAGMVRNFKRENKRVRVDCIPLADAGGAVKGAATIAFTGTATGTGSVYISVGSKNDHRYKVDVVVGDAHADIYTKLAAKLTADVNAPFTAADNVGTTTFTAANGGTLCNDWHIQVEGIDNVDGITAVTIVGWANGATDPVLTNILDVIGEIRYQTVVWPSAYGLSVIETKLNDRFNASNQVLDGVVIQVKKGTLSSLKSYAGQNSQSVVIVGNKTVNETDRKGTQIAEMPDTLAAQIAAIRSLRLTTEAPLSKYLTSVAARDQFGGIALGSLPYFNTVIPMVATPDERDTFSLTDQNDLRDSAVSLLGPNRAYNGVIMGEIVTTYLTDGAGNPDSSYKFLNTIDTASIIREFYYENCRKKYAQTRLTNGDLINGRDMANEGSIRAFFNQLYDDLADEALVQTGSAAKKDFNDNLVLSLDISTGKVTADMAPLLVSQLRLILGTIQINFGG